jgi:hypothetical protein
MELGIKDEVKDMFRVRVRTPTISSTVWEERKCEHRLA